MQAHLWTKRFFKKPLRNSEDVVMETDHHCCCIRHQNVLQLCQRRELTTQLSSKEIINKHADFYMRRGKYPEILALIVAYLHQ